MCKLKVLRNTIDIIDESIEVIKQSSTMPMITHEAQVMIQSYKQNEDLGQEYISIKLDGYGQEDDDENDDEESSDDEKEGYESSFNVRTLNLNELKNQERMSSGPGKHLDKDNYLINGGDKVSFFLLFITAFIYQFQLFLIVPCIFEFVAYLDYSPTYAGVLLALTPLATTCFAMLYNVWTKSDYKLPILMALFLTICSNGIYIKAFQTKSMTLLMLSRFLFGLGGSKVIHRKYIANYVPKRHWGQFNQYINLSTFLGMTCGSLMYLTLLLLNPEFILSPHLFVVPGYVGIVLSASFFICSLCFFKQTSPDKLKDSDYSFKVPKQASGARQKQGFKYQDSDEEDEEEEENRESEDEEQYYKQ